MQKGEIARHLTLRCVEIYLSLTKNPFSLKFTVSLHTSLHKNGSLFVFGLNKLLVHMMHTEVEWQDVEDEK